jgi:hypothetical protein
MRPLALFFLTDCAALWGYFRPRRRKPAWSGQVAGNDPFTMMGESAAGRCAQSVSSDIRYRCGAGF